MAMQSYLTLARYDNDDCSRQYKRARNLDDIRTRNRESIYRTRIYLKGQQMLQNRPTLSYYNGSSEQHSENNDVYESDTENDTFSTQRPNSLPLWVDTPDICDYDGSWNHPSSSSSCSSHYESNSVTPTTESFYPRSPCSPSSSVSSERTTHSSASAKQRRTPRSPLLSQAIYKHSGSSRSSPSPRPSYTTMDPMKAMQELAIIKDKLSISASDPRSINNLIRENSQTILNSLQPLNAEVLTESCQILSTLALKNLLLPDVVLHLLQHGLVYKLYDALQRVEDSQGYLISLELLTNLARSTPAIIPYMVELIANSKLRDALEEHIAFGSYSEAQPTIEFYCLITETLLSQLYSKSLPQPLIPDVILLTGVSKETIESYSPITTLLRCLTPNLLMKTIAKCLSRACASKLDVLNMALLLLANSLKLIHIMSSNNGYKESIVELLTALRSSNIEYNMGILITAIERRKQASESSEHCSQGVDVDSTSHRALHTCQQFMIFYKQYYNTLSANYSHLMEESTFEEPIRSQGWTL